jgi:hypothetical protein
LKLRHVRGQRIFGCQTCEGVVEREDQVRVVVCSAGDVCQIDLFAPAAALLTGLAPGMINEHPPHRLGSGGEEVGASVEVLVPNQS